MLLWERKFIALNGLLAILLGAAVLKACIFVDNTAYYVGSDRADRVESARQARAVLLILTTPKKNRQMRRHTR